MRLMEGEGGAGALVCLHCGAEAESKPPYEVLYCYCRSRRAERAADASGGLEALAAPLQPA